MTIALVDMGSNTVRMNVYRIEGNEFEMLFTSKVSAGLIGYVNDGKMSLRGIKAAIEVIEEFQSTTKVFGVDRFVVFATASLRNIENSSDAIEIIEQETGVKIHLISGEEEAKLDFVGATKVVDFEQGVLIDIGGGSTEIVIFENRQILHAVSIPIGSLNLYKKSVGHLLPTKQERRQMKKIINDELDKIDSMFQKKYFRAIGVGGTIRAGRKLSQAMFDKPSRDHDISANELKKMLKLISNDGREALDVLLQNVSDRIHTITPGLTILQEVCKRFEISITTVSDYGAREGYLFTHILKE